MAKLAQNLAFTIKYTGRVPQLITGCKICESFDPSLLHGKNVPLLNDFMALWDTGATGTVITKNVVDKLGLVPTGKVKSYHADGYSFVNTYMVNIQLPNNVGFHSITVNEGKLVGFDVLIGMNIISAGDFAISYENNNTVFTFRIPSVATIDFVEDDRKSQQEMRAPIVKDKLPERNDPCHCGSGKKYKNCHGK